MLNPAVFRTFGSKLAVQGRYNQKPFHRVLSRSLQGIAERPLPCNYNVIQPVSAFHGGNTGSNPVGDAKSNQQLGGTATVFCRHKKEQQNRQISPSCRSTAAFPKICRFFRRHKKAQTHTPVAGTIARMRIKRITPLCALRSAHGRRLRFSRQCLENLQALLISIIQTATQPQFLLSRLASRCHGRRTCGCFLSRMRKRGHSTKPKRGVRVGPSDSRQQRGYLEYE